MEELETGPIGRLGEGFPRSAIFRISWNEAELVRDSQREGTVPANVFRLEMRDSAEGGVWQDIGSYRTVAEAQTAANGAIGHEIAVGEWR